MTSPEQLLTFYQRGLMPEAGFRYTDVYADAARLLSIAYSEQHHEPPPRVHPQSFDEIWLMRDKLAKFNVSLGRSLEDQEAYYAFIKTMDKPDQLIVDKYFDGKISPDDRRFAIVPNEYPASMPSDAQHFLMWYIDNGLPNSWVVDKIAEYIIEQKLTTADFAAYRKPSNAGSFLPGFSRSISLPHVHLILRR
ncbi:MAG: hypothetical protein M1372_00110 [Patescibacteria group bacterium]|nr:hypothetical protein [Patescibacteria group bacterium]